MKTQFICDVDGCIVPPRGHLWDLDGLARLARGVHARTIPLTLCSGRPATFMEALARQLTITSHLICENGTLLFHPGTKRGIRHPAIAAEFFQDRPQIARVLETIVEGTPAMIELGKDVMFSINSPNPEIFGSLIEVIRDALKHAPVNVLFSGRSIEVLPLGVTKAEGLELWLELEDVAHQQTLSIGDADNDLEVLQAAHRAAAPANCTENVRKIADYVSPEPMVAGVLDIISWAQSRE